MPKSHYANFPSQKKSFAQKTKAWAEECIEQAEDFAIFRTTGIRESYRNKLVNYNLANDVLDTEDMEKVCNPLGLVDATFPAKMQNYPIANPKIDLLVGEERKRRFDWHVRVVNEDAISEKETEKKNIILNFLLEQIQSEATSEEELEKKLKELDKFFEYEFQDMRERTATQILAYLYKHLDLKSVFSRGFEDALIAGEEIYCADIIGGEPILRRVNPLNLHTVRSGESPWIEDADIVVEDGYWSPGQVIDMYYDDLSASQIKRIDEGLYNEGDGDFITIGEKEHSLVVEGILDMANASGGKFNLDYDDEGNLRVMRVCWKSMKKVGELTYYDDFGQPQTTVVSEFYKVGPEEEIKWKWISEWWEGTRIGSDIYIRIQPRPLQFRSMENISKCNSGYTGLAYNINNSKSKSLMDRMKPYQYLYNVFMYRTELAFAKAKGRIGKLDLSRIPEGWEVEKWMYYAETMGWAVEDPFRESNKGTSTGTLSGNMQQSTPVLDLELGNYIQQHIMMLQFIETQLGDIAGVSKQRQGQIENRELVGNVERAVTQSSHVTEKWFSLHGECKRRAMATLLETAKFAWKGDSKKLQYVTDELSAAIINLDGEQFNECEYGLTISDGTADNELIQTLKQLAHAGIQNDKVNFSQLMDIYSTGSINSMKRKIEKAEAEKIQRDQEQMQMQQQMQQQQLQAAAQEKQAEREFEMQKLDKEFQNEVYLKQMDIAAKSQEKFDDKDADGIPDLLELEKLSSQERLKMEEIKSKEKMAAEDRKHESKENEKERQNKLKLEDKKVKKQKTSTK